MDTKKTAKAIKALLVKMAVDDKLPLDMNGLPISGIEKILKKAVKDAEPTGLQQAIKEAQYYLCDGELSVAEQVELITDEEDLGKNLEDIEGVIVWQPLEGYFTVESFIKQINFGR